MKPKVSVIVPVYNTAPFLGSCLESLRVQTLREIEFILIDDGSTDESGDICHAFAAHDNRFRVIHKENAGVSRARNDGLREAGGEFIGFIDSDDTIAPGMFQALYTLAKGRQADIVICDSAAVGDCGPDALETLSSLPKSCLLTRQSISPDMLLELAGSVCRCLYRREMLSVAEITFPEDLKLSEDRIFNIRAMGAASRLYYDKTARYFRRLHNQSAVHKFYPDYFQIAKDAARHAEQAIKDFWSDDEAVQTAYLRQFTGASITAINHYFYQNSTFSRREAFQKVQALCEDSSLRDAISRSRSGGVRGKWILKKRVCLLCACAVYLNKKYGR